MLGGRQQQLLLVASSAALVLLTIALINIVSTERHVGATELAGRNVRYMQARALSGGSAMLQQKEKVKALDSLEDGLRQGLVADIFKPAKDSPKLCSGRGCTWENPAVVPQQVAFECGGQREANTCVLNVQTCVDKAEATIATYYKENPQRAREARAAHLCKCFVSNGCGPSCNVAMYMVWETGSGVQCPARPPTYMPSARAFRYGDVMSQEVMPSDISYDYFPEYPSPAGRTVNVEDMRRTYHSDNETPQTLPPYHPWHWGQYQYPAAETYYHQHNYYSPFYGASWRPYSYSFYPWYGSATQYGAGNKYGDPYWYTGADTDSYDGRYGYYGYYGAEGDGTAWEKYGDYHYDPYTGEVVF
mmetsp:Transcript_34275/g.70716  ORF Transcript_34275/g.70716 Transcript_34275/m.70716 type:complete len:360 (+) Transcript_34275:55-1134(+)